MCYTVWDYRGKIPECWPPGWPPGLQTTTAETCFQLSDGVQLPYSLSSGVYWCIHEAAKNGNKETEHLFARNNQERFELHQNLMFSGVERHPRHTWCAARGRVYLSNWSLGLKEELSTQTRSCRKHLCHEFTQHSGIMCGSIIHTTSLIKLCDNLREKKQFLNFVEASLNLQLLACVSAVHLCLQVKGSAGVGILLVLWLPAVTRLGPELVRVERTVGGQLPAGLTHQS